MGYTNAVTRIGALEAQIVALRTGVPPSAQAAATAPASGGAPVTAGGTSPTFASMLAQAQAPSPVGAPGAALGTGQTAGASLPPGARGQLTSSQQSFAARLAADTGLSPTVISAWLLAEESGGAAASRQSQNNNDWLNIGYTDSGTFGASDSVWSDPVGAADATAGWLKGQKTIPGYGAASSGIQAILATAGQPVAAQVAAIQSSGWASSGYPDLPGLVAQLGG